MSFLVTYERGFHTQEKNLNVLNLKCKQLLNLHGIVLNISKIEYLEIEESFLDKIKNIFHSFSGVII